MVLSIQLDFETNTYLTDIYEINIIANARASAYFHKGDFKSNKQSVVFSNPDFYLDEVKVVENIDLENKYLKLGIVVKLGIIWRVLRR